MAKARNPRRLAKARALSAAINPPSGKKASPLKANASEPIDKSESLALEILAQFRDLKLKLQKERDLWKKCFEYVNARVDGEIGQWKQELRKELSAQGRPVTTFNIVKKFVNRLCGAQSALRLDEKVFPESDDANPLVADVLGDVIKSVKEKNKGDLHTRRAFRDAAICSTGWVKVEWSDEFDPYGDIVIKSVSPHRVFIIGDGEDYDVSRDRKGLIEMIPMDKEAIKARWPNHDDEIDNLIEDADKDEIPIAHTYDYGFGLAVPTEYVYDKKDKKLYVIRRQYVEYKRVTFIEDPQTKKLTEAPADAAGMSALEDIAASTGIAVKKINKSVRTIRVSYIVGNILLEDGPSPYKHGRFDLINFFCYTDDGLETGIVQDLLDPQDEKNKRRSQAIHLLGTAAKNSYFSKKGAFDDINKARTEMGKTGALIEINTTGSLRDAVVPIESNTTAVPALLQLDALSGQDMKDISGIQDASLGVQPEGAKSGRQVALLQAPVESIIAEIHGNYLYSRQMIYMTVLALVKQYYTEEKRVRIAGDYLAKMQPPEVVAMKDQLKLQLQAAGMDEAQAILQAEDMIEVRDKQKILVINRMVLNKKINDVTQGDYSVMIDEVAQSPSARQQQYQDMMNMKAMGAPIAWDLMVKYSDIRGKMEIISRMDEEEQKQTAIAMAGAKPKPHATPPGGGQPGDQMLNQSGGQF